MAPRVYWSDDHTRKLLEIVGEERAKGNSKMDWRKIAVCLNGRCGTNYTSKQVSNHFNDLKNKFKTWVQLENMTGISFDANTGLPVVEESYLERFEEFKQKNKKATDSLLKFGLQNLDLLRPMLSAQIATGRQSFSPAMVKATSYLNKGKKHVYDLDKEGSGDTDDESEKSHSLSLSDGFGEESKSPTKSSKRKSDGCSTMTSKRHREDSNIEKAYAVMSMKSKAEKIADILEEMEIDKIRGNAYFVDAMTILGDEKKGEIFLALKNTEQRFISLDKWLPYVYKPTLPTLP